MTLIRRLALILCLAGFASVARADQQDLTAAARGVVRVAIVATDGNQSYFVGHGTGFAVAPDKILTNAHVVELVREERNLVIGVVPSEGKKSYGGKIVAFSPGNDLALIQLDEGALPVSTFYAGAPQDGQHVTAIGYPGTVDRAQGLDLQQMVQPLIPVKTSGNISSGRSSKGYDTILHTAPLAAGNSGGPLVDDCGRVLGVNSFGSVSDGGNDAEFGFAVSNREIANFLRQAGVQFLRTTAECKSIAQITDEDARRTAEEAAQKDAAARARDEAHDAAMAKARESAEQQVISGRENAMAIAAVLLALAVLGIGAAGLNYNQGKQKPAMWFGIGGGALLLGALLTFLLRPSFSSIDERVVMPDDGQVTSASTYAPLGDNICLIDTARSRITVSDMNDVAINWAAGGCVNGKTQFIPTRGPAGEIWSRILAPAEQAVLSVNSFDPQTGTYRSERYLADAETLERAREVRAKSDSGQCSTDPQAIEKIKRMQDDLRAILPPQPNERLVYHCQKGAASAAKPGN
ncbi:trypsin-like peptidase domain-containing protein [Sphingobium phenoxybenzoativorans]|uniref:Trypsin-like peptidase domain-containing protein n=1 Tax=Sphingobium phenoxybenzoativorans TaxID=1592790 RepID=A0A975K404_9SPHN|nr:serine protease [Sphingobium phenoxybenzoativorans]QUT04431.1 trypsin-like peptidase domain-containing protein [Sphingobium phenoxybenzoativorans]